MERRESSEALVAVEVDWDSDLAAFSVSAGGAAVDGVIWGAVIVKEKREKDANIVQRVKK